MFQKFLTQKSVLVVHFRVSCCCPMTALQVQEDSSHISVTLLCKLNVLSTFSCTSMGSLSIGIRSSPSLWTSLFTSVTQDRSHCSLCGLTSEAPSVKALNLGQTLEVERSRYLSHRHLPQETFPVGPVYSAFEEDVTYIFLHKLRAFFFFFFARLFQAGICVQSPVCPRTGVDFWGVIYGQNANYLTTNM